MKKSFSEFPRGHLDFVTLKQSRTSHNIHVFFFNALNSKAGKTGRTCHALADGGWQGRRAFLNQSKYFHLVSVKHSGGPTAVAVNVNGLYCLRPL